MHQQCRGEFHGDKLTYNTNTELVVGESGAMAWYMASSCPRPSQASYQPSAPQSPTRNRCRMARLLQANCRSSSPPPSPQHPQASCAKSTGTRQHRPRTEATVTDAFRRRSAKSFKARKVVRDFAFSIREGEVVGLLGPNGAGKTTCFYMVVGLIEADAGSIKLDKQDITGLPMHARAKLGIGYLPQEASVFRRLSVSDNILAVLELREGLSQQQRNQRAGKPARRTEDRPHRRSERHQPVRWRAPPRGNCPRAGRAAALHAAGRTVRRRRSDLGR
jgi:ABC-type glutathione transport system ATPase component